MRNKEFSWFVLIPLFQILLVSDITCVYGQCPDRSLLLQLKDGLKFDSLVSKKLVRWNQSTADCCKWEGVSCDETSGHVIGLELDGEAISGGIFSGSSALYQFEHLQKLNMANNNFNSTEIPSGLFNLTSLINLNLSNCGFAGQIPQGFSRLKTLRILDLSTLYVTGKSAPKIENPNFEMIFQNLEELTELYLDGVNMTAQAKTWSQAISSSLPKLRVLSLSNSRISGPIDPSFGKMLFLSEIRLDQNSLNDTVPEFLANLRNLTTLRLSFCNLQGIFPARILQIPRLQVLDLSYNIKLQGSWPKLPQIGLLTTLVLSLTNFSGTIPESIGNLKMLSRIEIQNCSFSGTIPSSIGKLRRLVHLDFWYNNLTGYIPLLQNSKNLTYLDLSHNRLSGTISPTYFEGLENLVHVDLGFNVFNGTIPSSLFALPSLRKIMLSQNQFSGLLATFSNASGSQLDTLDISGNSLTGSIPLSWFELERLNILSLSSNQLTGTLQLETIHNLGNLTTLDLSYNNLSIETSRNSSSETLPPQYHTFRLASCKLTSFPNLGNQSRLTALDLSDNQIGGVIPNWIWNIGDGSFVSYLNISSNRLVGFEEPYVIPRLDILDLHSNQLTGEIPVPPETASYVDYSFNNFNSSFSPDIGKNLRYAYFFSVSTNKLVGNIPHSICEALYLRVLDLSNNDFKGVIPSCLLEMSKYFLAVLNLGNNNFSGRINTTFEENCSLQTLDMHANHLEGNVPRSLYNCTNLEVLNLGNNQISDSFPCFLKNSSNLRVLVLRLNQFHGEIHCPRPRSHWSKLQIIDIASNNFTGKVPENYFLDWTAMMGDEDAAVLEDKPLGYKVMNINNFYYQDTVTVTVKGVVAELVKILTIFNSIDISCNQFEGNIPEEMGKLKMLYFLNISHNALTGTIPSSIGNLEQLESLDLSVNQLSGRIPKKLTNLNFLSSLDLSYNQLSGEIPSGKQFNTFENSSYTGNKGLCGRPLTSKCPGPQDLPSSGPHKRSADSSCPSFDWQFIFTGIGFGVGAAIMLGPLMFFQKQKHWLDVYIDELAHTIVHNFGLVSNHYDVVEEGPDKAVYYSDEEDGSEDGEFAGGRYCLLCSKLDMLRMSVVHDPKCMCRSSTPVKFSSSPSSSFSPSSSNRTP